MSDKLRKMDDGSNYFFYCPGCKHGHRYEVPRWTFTGDMENPTFRPSLLNYYTHPKTGQRVTTCHLHITNGQIEFCGDCEHELSGKTVPMVDFPADYHTPR